MKGQISIPEVREVIKTTKAIVPILNSAELATLMLFYSKVLARYEKEEYPEGLPADD